MFRDYEGGVNTTTRLWDAENKENVNDEFNEETETLRLKSFGEARWEGFTFDTARRFTTAGTSSPVNCSNICLVLGVIAGSVNILV